MKALIIIDMLRDFMEKGGALYCGDDSRNIIPFIKKKIEECKKEECKVIYLCDAHDAEDKEFKMYAPHCVKGSEGAQIIGDLTPGEDDIVIEKDTLSVFYNTTLEEELKKINPDKVVVLGVCTSICVMDAVGDLRVRGYDVTVYKDGVADFDNRAHEFALKRIEKIYGATVI